MTREEALDTAIRWAKTAEKRNAGGVSTTSTTVIAATQMSLAYSAIAEQLRHNEQAAEDERLDYYP